VKSFRPRQRNDRVERKVGGAEKGRLVQGDAAFHEREFERLRSELEQAFEQCQLPDVAHGAAALNDLLVRLRLRAC